MYFNSKQHFRMQNRISEAQGAKCRVKNCISRNVGKQPAVAPAG